jgi:hypothetical protein
MIGNYKYRGDIAMGRYFSIVNATRRHHVSEGISCWKGYSWCDLYVLMHLYHWDVKDEIVSSCYDTVCRFKYDEKKNEMTYDDVTWEDPPEEEAPKSKDESKEPYLKLGMHDDPGYDHPPRWAISVWEDWMSENPEWRMDPQKMISAAPNRINETIEILNAFLMISDVSRIVATYSMVFVHVCEECGHPFDPEDIVQAQSKYSSVFT